MSRNMTENPDLPKVTSCITRASEVTPFVHSSYLPVPCIRNLYCTYSIHFPSASDARPNLEALIIVQLSSFYFI